MPGSYGVAITKMPGAEAAAAAGGQMDEDAAYRAMEEAGVDVTGTGAGPVEEAKSELPAKYGGPDTSGFSADVAEGQDNTFTFDLKSEG